MKRIDSHSFNNEVLAEINKVKTALTKITPENVKYFDDELLRKARGVVNYPDEYKWGDSIINGIDVRTVKRMTEYLKLKKQEFVVLKKMDSFYLNSITTSDHETIDFGLTIDVPKGFDGRNSFVKHVFVNSAKVYQNEIGEWVNLYKACTINVVKNKDKITFNASIPSKRLAAYDYYPGYALHLTALVWRKK